MRMLLTVFVFPIGRVWAYEPDIPRLRALYYKAPQSKAATDEFFNAVNQGSAEQYPIISCYKGVALMMKANFSMNPYLKLNYFNKGKTLIAEAVKRDPRNIEIRFIRFCAQTNAPFFLGYNNEIEGDKYTILHSLRTLSDADLKEKMRAYMISSDYCSKDEKSVLL
jgi:hypothetical protein